MNGNWRNGEAAGAWLSRRAPTIASLGIIIAIAYVLARLTWLALPQPPQPVAAAAPGPAATTAGARPSAATQAAKVAAMHLFGRAHNAASAAQAPNAPETNLNVTLRGIIAADNSKRSRALIAAGSNHGKPYAVGASIPGGAAVHAIYSDRVILDRHGHLETLKLPHADEKSAHGRIEVTTKSPPANGAPPGLELPEKPGRAPAGYIVPGAHGLIRADPAVIGGEMKGYRVFPGKNPSKFLEAGMQPRDIIEAINGKPLTDPRNLAVLIDLLNHHDSVVLTVVRHGQERQIRVALPK